MDSLIDRIDENRLDALYMFINESLRDPSTFNRFLDSMLAVLPHNWSIQRVEVGHEFLSMTTRQPSGQQPQLSAQNSAESPQQKQLFETICSLEALKTLIFSDGYVPRKDMGSIQTRLLLNALPRATNLCNLDVQRLHLEDQDSVHHLAEVFETMADSLEEVRITGIFLSAKVTTLDPVLDACTNMSNLRSLAISTTFEFLDGASAQHREFISHQSLLRLCQNSTTLQDLSLRSMQLDDAHCLTIANALTSNSFLTTLDIRQNSRITQAGYTAILEALERNYDLWCTVNVDNENFQGKFTALIELNQASRGDLIRSPTREKLVEFLAKLSNDPTAVWYFLTIHDNILHPIVAFLRWKHRTEQRRKEEHRQPDSLSQQQVPSPQLFAQLAPSIVTQPGLLPPSDAAQQQQFQLQLQSQFQQAFVQQMLAQQMLPPVLETADIHRENARPLKRTKHE